MSLPHEASTKLFRGRHFNHEIITLCEKRDKAAAQAFFCSACTVTGHTPAWVTSDGHDAYPGAIKAELGAEVRHRTNRYLNDH